MARDISKVLIKIEDDAAWDTMIDQSTSKLIVVDCHQDWCGCCEAIHPSLNRILLDYDGVEDRFAYYTASMGKVGAKIQSSLPTESHISLEKNGCLPLFAVFRVSFRFYPVLQFFIDVFIRWQHKECITVVCGVDSPTLLQQIAQNIPDKPTKE